MMACDKPNNTAEFQQNYKSTYSLILLGTTKTQTKIIKQPSSIFCNINIKQTKGVGDARQHGIATLYFTAKMIQLVYTNHARNTHYVHS